MLSFPRKSADFLLSAVLSATLGLVAPVYLHAPALAEDCPGHPDALGTSRVLLSTRAKSTMSASCNTRKACRSPTRKLCSHSTTDRSRPTPPRCSISSPRNASKPRFFSSVKWPANFPQSYDASTKKDTR